MLCFRLKKETSKNVADTTFKLDIWYYLHHWIFTIQLHDISKDTSACYLIESTLLRQKGVVDVSIISNCVNCVYNATIVGPRDLQNILKNLGFTVRLNNQGKEDLLSHTNEIRQ